MRNSATKRLLSALAVAALLAQAGFGCTSDSTQANNGTGLDIEADAGEADAGEGGDDAGDDAGEADIGFTGEPLRTLTTRALLGEMPASNHVLDPIFSSFGTGAAWLTYGPDGGHLVPARRRVEPRSPAGAPMLEVMARGDGSGALVLGRLLLTRPPLDVSIWIGTPEADEASPFDVSASVLGMDVDDPTNVRGVTLGLETTEIVDGVAWRRYRSTLSGYAGYGYIAVEATTGGALYVHAPVATAAETPANALIDPSALRGQRRAASAPELRAIGEFEARQWQERNRPQIPRRYQERQWP